MNDANAIRAISAEFLGRKLRVIAIVFAVIVVSIAVLMIWLISLSAWWLILAIPVFLFTFMAVIASLVVTALFRSLRPKMSTSEREKVKQFVDKLESVTETAQTPMPIILFKVAMDGVRPKERTFVQSTIENSTSLKSDYKNLRK